MTRNTQVGLACALFFCAYGEDKYDSLDPCQKNHFVICYINWHVGKRLQENWGTFLLAGLITADNGPTFCALPGVIHWQDRGRTGRTKTVGISSCD